MLRQELEQVLIDIATRANIKVNQITIDGFSAMVFHGVVEDSERLFISAHEVNFNKIIDAETAAGKTVKIETVAHPAYGKVKLARFDKYNIICIYRIPSWHCVVDLGMWNVLSMNALLVSLFKAKQVSLSHSHTADLDEKIESLFKHGAYLLLESWTSDIDMIQSQYRQYPQYFSIIEDEEHPQVMWKTQEGIETFGDDHIFLEYVGMMYIDVS